VIGSSARRNRKFSTFRLVHKAIFAVEGGPEGELPDPGPIYVRMVSKTAALG
jgi:hypothetical protein